VKKILIIAACLLVASTAAFAQIETFGGIKFGITATKFNAGQGGYGGEYMAALHGGFYFEIKPIQKLGIQPEVLYSRQGAKSGVLKYNFDYVNVPLMINFYPAQKFYIQAGPQWGYLVAAKITDGKNTFDVKDQVNTMDLAIAGGVGYKFGIISVSARYNHGVKAITKKNNPVNGLTTREALTNRVFQVSLGLRLK
jgi:hypothetical protein